MRTIIELPPGYTIEREKVIPPDSADMVMEVHNYTASLYPPEFCYGFQPHQLEASNIYFHVIRYQGLPVACGALKISSHDTDSYCELKRMYVRSAHRGRGLAKYIIQKLEGLALDLNQSIIYLETGIYQPDAIALYENLGYQKREVFGDYRPSSYNLFYEKRLRP